MPEVILNSLPKEHPLRNTPLGEINAEYRWKQATPNAPWRTVHVGAPKLTNKTFNQLGSSWTDHDLWKVETNDSVSRKTIESG